MEGFMCFVVPVLIIVVALVLLARGRAATQDAINAAYSNYQEALAALRKEPHRQELRQRALDLGRRYASLTRQQGGATIYDEMAMMNDINAAAGPALTVPAPTVASTAPTQSIEDRLKSLEGLRTKGVITEEEYASRRAALINEL